MKAIGWMAGATTLLGSTVYMVISLNRWEWNRALFFGLLVVIAELALATGLILQKLSRIEARTPRPDPLTLQVIRETRPPHPNRFAWLDPTASRTNVFITFLVGGGVLVSAVAWLIDRLASKTTTPVGEERLARQLGPISYPKGGLLVDDVTSLAQRVPGCDDEGLRILLRRPDHG